MARERLELRRWRWVMTQGWIAFFGLFALISWIVTVGSLVWPDENSTYSPWESALFSAVPALALSAVTVVVYRVRLRAARRLLREGMVVVATVLFNVPFPAAGQIQATDQLGYEWYVDGRRYTRRIDYAVNMFAFRLVRRIRGRLGASLTRDDTGWLKSLKPGDTFLVLVDPQRPRRSHVLRLWTEGRVWHDQRVGAENSGAP